MGYNKNTLSMNVEILIDLCGGNLFETLHKARRYERIKINITKKTLEREIVKKLIDLGWKNIAICEALGVLPNTVSKIRGKHESSE